MEHYKGYYSYVRRLGQWHLMGTGGYTLCDKPILSQNRVDYIPIDERIKCPKCFAIADQDEKKGDQSK